MVQQSMPLVHCRCWLDGGKGSLLVKTEWWDASVVVSRSRCRFAYGPADATATHYLLLQEIQIGFTFLVPAHLGSPRQNPQMIVIKLHIKENNAF